LLEFLSDDVPGIAELLGLLPTLAVEDPLEAFFDATTAATRQYMLECVAEAAPGTEAMLALLEVASDDSELEALLAGYGNPDPSFFTEANVSRIFDH
jgi:hypothetical protein